AAGDGGCRAAARSARRAGCVPGVAGRVEWVTRGEFGRGRFAEYDGSRFAQCSYARAIAAGVPAGVKRRPHLRRHVGCLDDVLDADGHAVDLRQRSALAPTFGRAVRCRLGILNLEMSEGADLRFELCDCIEAAFKERAWRVSAGFEVRGRGVERA